MSPFDSLLRHFERFPGIGPRQAKRFVFHLLTLPPQDLADLSELIKNIQDTVIACPSCHRYHTWKSENNLCRVCGDGTRDDSKLTVVERDSDVDAIERGGVYDGKYFVLGGTVPLLESKEAHGIRGAQLKHMLTERGKDTKEIILAFSINPDGENTARYVEMLLKDIVEENNIKLTHLGRGLSTGSELEYADPETIKNAFQNRN